jgi:hypothetical protein
MPREFQSETAPVLLNLLLQRLTGGGIKVFLIQQVVHTARKIKAVAKRTG